jgi:hypothetical protein
MTVQKKDASADCSSRDVDTLSVQEDTRPQHNNQIPARKHRGSDAAEAIFELGGLRDRIEADPVCSSCGARVELAPGDQVADCSSCDETTPAEAARRWGGLADRLLGSVCSLGWRDSTIVAQRGGRPVANIDLQARAATLDPQASDLCSILREANLAVNEGEVAA